eukprot:7260622-Alexandrium_andersonii.AAC.1
MTNSQAELSNCTDEERTHVKQEVAIMSTRFDALQLLWGGPEAMDTNIRKFEAGQVCAGSPAKAAGAAGGAPGGGDANSTTAGSGPGR